MQTVSVYFVFECFRGLISSIWKTVSKTFHCKFMTSSKSRYIIFHTSTISKEGTDEGATCTTGKARHDLAPYRQCDTHYPHYSLQTW